MFRWAFLVSTAYSVSCGLENQVIDDVMSFVDVMQGAVAETSYPGVVFFAGDVVVRFIKQFERAMEATGPVHAGVDWRMVVQVLAVVDGGAFDFFNGAVNFFDGMLFFLVHVVCGGKVFQVSAGVAQVGEGVQIGRMHSRFFGKGEGSANGEKQRNQGAIS
jgi:hypothetical protein